ncbi:MAG: amidohydrolase [Oscillospiraceae bacterium]|jgi:amidohydrolase|nr:amidohydrolase [Oscillospiraceae bacterium]
MRIHPEINSLLDNCIAFRQSLHRIPETGFEEYETGAFIERELRRCSPDRIERLAGTGLKAVYYAKNPAETVAFRADMDGLNSKELCDVPYKSTHEGKMHGCGHDGHMTILLLLAKLLSAHREELRSNVVLLFQPAEEGKGGASRMIAGGAMKNPDVDRIFGLHVWPEVPKGKVGIRWGSMMAQTCEFDIVVHGRSAHAASPQMGVDAVVSASTLVTLFQTAISRNVDPHQDALLTIGKIKGGVARNVIADQVTMNATLRVFSKNVYDQLMQRLYYMAEGLTVATGAKFDIIELMHYPCVDNPRHMVEDFYRYMDDMADVVLVEPVMAAEDYSCYQQEVPGLFFFLGIGGGKNSAPLHNGNFDFDEDALLMGLEVYRRILGLCKSGA